MLRTNIWTDGRTDGRTDRQCGCEKFMLRKDNQNRILKKGQFPNDCIQIYAQCNHYSEAGGPERIVLAEHLNQIRRRKSKFRKKHFVFAIAFFDPYSLKHRV